MKILIIDDVKSWVHSIQFRLQPEFAKRGKKLNIIHRVNGDYLTSDLVMGVDLVMVDYDLGGIYGDEIITEIASFPEYSRLPIIFYSGGITVDELRQKSKDGQFGHVICKSKSEIYDEIIARLG